VSLEHILLGLLRQPASGYDLKAAIDSGIGHFWAAELSQIYPTLKKLQKSGLLRSRNAPSKRGPGRLVYETTAKGHTELANWLKSGPQIGDARHTFLAQIFLMDELKNYPSTLQFLEQLRDRWAMRLAALEGIEKMWSARVPNFPEALPLAEFHRHMTLRMGIESNRAWLTWCDESIHRVQERIRKEKNRG